MITLQTALLLPDGTVLGFGYSEIFEEPPLIVARRSPYGEWRVWDHELAQPMSAGFLDGRTIVLCRDGRIADASTGELVADANDVGTLGASYNALRTIWARDVVLGFDTPPIWLDGAVPAPME